MRKLEKLHKEMQKENRRIEMIKNTKGIDVDFMRNTIKESKSKLIELQTDFDNEYESQI